MTTQDDDAFRIPCRVMRIIAGSLLAGLCLFTGLAVFLVNQGGQPAPGGAFGGLPVISLLSCALAAMNLILSIVIPRAVARNNLRQMATHGDTSPTAGTGAATIIGLWQSTRIIGFALLEGAGFFGAVAYLVERHWLGLAVALESAIVILLRFPTEAGARAWVQRHEAMLDEMRLSADA